MVCGTLDYPCWTTTLQYAAVSGHEFQSNKIKTEIKSEISSEEALNVGLKDSLCQFKTDIIMTMKSISANTESDNDEIYNTAYSHIKVGCETFKHQFCFQYTNITVIAAIWRGWFWSDCTRNCNEKLKPSCLKLNYVKVKT